MNKQNVNKSPGFQKNLKLSLCILHGLRVPIAKSTRLHDHPAIPGPQKEAFWLLTKSHSSSKQYHWWHRGHHGTSIIYKHANMYTMYNTHICHTHIYIYRTHTHTHIYIYIYHTPISTLSTKRIVHHHRKHTSHHTLQPSSTCHQHWSMIFLWGTHLCWLPKTPISHFFPPGYQLKGDVRWTAMDPAPALLKKRSHLEGPGTVQLMDETKGWIQIVFECTLVLFS